MFWQRRRQHSATWLAVALGHFAAKQPKAAGPELPPSLNTPGVDEGTLPVFGAIFFDEADEAGVDKVGNRDRGEYLV